MLLIDLIEKNYKETFPKATNIKLPSTDTHVIVLYADLVGATFYEIVNPIVTSGTFPSGTAASSIATATLTVIPGSANIQALLAKYGWSGPQAYEFLNIFYKSFITWIISITAAAQFKTPVIGTGTGNLIFKGKADFINSTKQKALSKYSMQQIDKEGKLVGQLIKGAEDLINLLADMVEQICSTSTVTVVTSGTPSTTPPTPVTSVPFVEEVVKLP